MADILGELFRPTGNHWLYNIYTFFEFSTLLMIYYTLLEERFSKKLVMVLSVLFYIWYAVSFQFESLQTYSLIILGFVITTFIFLYLKELLNSNKITSFQVSLPFWISVGFLIYYLGTLPFFSLLYLGGMKDRLLFTVLETLIVVMHLIFIIGLVWSKKPLKQSL
ncbi:MAG: hypothetical protein CMB99_10975 [Flavobacteriaceae bacterium]|nr:hypothetical protein [Flavobacteriaceae bacterium]